MDSDDLRNQILSDLGGRLEQRRATLDRLADATVSLDAATAEFRQAYAAAVASGWVKTELAKCGIREPSAPSTKRKRTPKRLPMSDVTES